jgi:hypothetical protein
MSLKSLRKEVLDYTRSSERLIAAASHPDHTPFCHEEKQMIHYYTDEVGKLVHDSSSGRPLLGSHMWKFLELPRNLVREYMEVCRTLLNERNLS